VSVLTPTDSGHDVVVPLAGHASGRLAVNGDSTRLTVRDDAPPDTLALVRFSAAAARVEAVGDEVTVAFGRGGLFGLRAWLTGEHTEILLARTVPWVIELRDGVTRLDADLRDLRLRNLAVRGGVSDAELHLPRPHGTVPIMIEGGVAQLTVRIPVGTAARLELDGVATDLVMDGERLDAVVGGLTRETPGYAGATDRYEITVEGSAARLAIVAGRG
jgi:hypothetical protein